MIAAFFSAITERTLSPRKEGYHMRPEQAWRCPEPDCNAIFDGQEPVCPCCGNRFVLRLDGATISRKYKNELEAV